MNDTPITAGLRSRIGSFSFSAWKVGTNDLRHRRWYAAAQHPAQPADIGEHPVVGFQTCVRYGIALNKTMCLYLDSLLAERLSS
jgi:hypothetical protein